MDIITQANNLPTKIEDLSRFVLVGREKMVSVRAEIRAIDKLGLGKEVRQQKLDEGQMIADALLDAEVRLGELMREIPKAKNQYESASNNAVTSTKEQALKEIGFDKMQASRFQTLAAHPEIVAQAKVEAREKDRMVSRDFVLEKIKGKQRDEKADNRRAKINEIIDGAQSDDCFVNGDCLVEMQSIKDGSVACVITDPPYGIDYVSNYRVIDNDVDRNIENDTAEKAISLWDKTCAILYDKMAENSHLYAFTSWKVYPEFKAITEKYFQVKNCLVWVKNSGRANGNSVIQKHGYEVLSSRSNCKGERRQKVHCRG